jgi:hypothetical protein
VCDPGYPEHAQLLNDAGPAVVPVLTEMVGDRHLSAWFVSSAAHWAARYPFDERFRQALRGRRDDSEFGHDHGARLGVFRYFVAFGDESDLAWMERAAETLDKRRRPIGDEEIRKLRARLLRSRAAAEPPVAPDRGGIGFSRFNVSPAAAAGERGRSASSEGALA